MAKNLIFKLRFLVTGTLGHLRHWSKPNCTRFHGKKRKNNRLLSSNSPSVTRSHKQRRTKLWDIINIRDCCCIMTILKQWCGVFLFFVFVSISIKESFRKEQGEGLNVSLVEVYEKFLPNASKWWRQAMGQMDLSYLTSHLIESWLVSHPTANEKWECKWCMDGKGRRSPHVHSVTYPSATKNLLH